MRVKLDENLGQRTVALFVHAGHDVATVHHQEMAGASDEDVFDACRREGRLLVTLDLDFANPMRFDPAGGPGCAVLRVTDSPSQDDLLRAASTLLVALGGAAVEGRLWVVDRQRVRQYEPG